MYFKKAAVLGLAVAGAAYAEAAQITKRDGAHGHSHAAAAPAPASGYGAPAASYGAPAPDTGYGAPDTGYGAPDTGYGAPDTGYDAPAETYDAAPSYGADGEVGPGILPFVAVILAIIGLSLLFPAVVNIERKKRSVAEESNPVYDLAERVQDMYRAVERSEECMEKIVCELGGMAKDLNASPVTGLVEAFIPSKYSNYYKQFRSGKDCHKIKC